VQALSARDIRFLQILHAYRQSLAEQNNWPSAALTIRDALLAAMR
jgi:hypothetical protein